MPSGLQAERGGGAEMSETQVKVAYKPAHDLGIMSNAYLETMHRAYIETGASPDKYALFVSLRVCGQKVA